jgi:putative FmdB family regulatory protein
MPIHDFRCRACDARFELLIRAGAPAVCPKCGGVALEKLLSAAAPPGKSAGIIAKARAQAARAGHLSNE